MVQTFGYTMTPALGSDILIYDEGFNLVSVARRAFSIMFNDEVVTRTKGLETLTFEISNSEKSYTQLKAERLIDFGGRWFRIKLLEDTYYSRRITKVTCYALWNEIAEGPEKSMNFTNTTLPIVLDILAVGTNVEFKVPSNLQGLAIKGLSGKRNSTLYHYRYILKQYGLETLFGYEKTDTGVKVIAIPQKYEESRIEWPLVVAKTLSDVKRVEDSRDLCTRYTLLGKDGNGDDITVSTINNGNEYIENFVWFDKMGMTRRIIPVTKSDDRFKDKDSMLEAMRSYLAIYSKPFVSYDVDALLYQDSGIPELLHSQLILDENYLITEWRKVSSRSINYSSLQKSSIVFDDPRQDLVDLLNGSDEY